MNFKDVEDNEHWTFRINDEETKIILGTIDEDGNFSHYLALDQINASRMMEALSYAHARIDPMLRNLGVE